MGLFDNIFLDQETPVATIEKPKLDPPVSDKTDIKQADTDTSLGEMFSPVIEETSIAPSPDVVILDENKETPSDVSFDIGGDIDFSATSPSDALSSSEPESAGTFIANGEIIEAPAEMMTPEENTSSIAMIQGATNASGTLIVEGTPGEILPSDGLTIETVEENSNLPQEETKDGGLFGMLDTPVENLEVIEEITTDTSPIIAAEESVFPQPGENGEIILREGLSPLQEMLERYIRELQSLGADEQNKALEAKDEDIKKREVELEEEFTTRKRAIAYERAEIAREKEANATEIEKLERIIESLKKELA